MKDELDLLLEGKTGAQTAGMHGIYSREPEKIEMPENTVEGIYRLCTEGELEFRDIVAKLNPENLYQVTGRVKSIESLERKLKDWAMEPKEMDDVSGKMLVVNSVNDVLKIADIMKEDPACIRIHDYLTADPIYSAGYYAIHGTYKLSNGAICELQVITKKCVAYKSSWGHIMYEALRELEPKSSNNLELKKLCGKIFDCLVDGYAECRYCDEHNLPLHRPSFEFTLEEMKTIEENTTESTFNRIYALWNKNNHNMDEPIKKKGDVNLIEHIHSILGKAIK